MSQAADPTEAQARATVRSVELERQLRAFQLIG